MGDLSTLQHLPNELLMEIFEYIPVQDLYQAFFKLNSRLTSILNSLQNLHLELKTSGNIDDDSIYVDRITTLVVRHSNSIDLSRYSNLRALMLEWPNVQQCQQAIRQTRLEHLHVGHPVVNNDTEHLLDHIFSNGFPHLRSCHMENIRTNFPVLTEPPILLPLLRSIKVLTTNSQDFAPLLSICPNLNRLSIKFFVSPIANLDILKRILPLPHQSLRRLTLDNVAQMSIATIDTMLQLVPNISHLSINSPRCQTSQISIEQLAHSLHSRVHNLRRFKAKIWLDDLSANSRKLENINEMSRLHSLFNKVQVSPGRSQLLIASMIPEKEIE